MTTVDEPIECIRGLFDPFGTEIESLFLGEED